MLRLTLKSSSLASLRVMLCSFRERCLIVILVVYTKYRQKSIAILTFFEIIFN
jgi:hypothetical protein